MNKVIDPPRARKTHCCLFNLSRGCLTGTEDEAGDFDSRACIDQ
jgi:hypothetical protein